MSAGKSGGAETCVLRATHGTQLHLLSWIKHSSGAADGSKLAFLPKPLRDVLRHSEGPEPLCPCGCA